MKTNVKLLVATALIATACTTGSKVTTGGYSDDLYYTPGDAQPIRSKQKVEKKEVSRQPQQKSTVAMQIEENEQGKVVNNYVVPKSSRKDNNAYYFEDQPARSDTTLEYKDNKEQVTINNYYEGEEMNYSSRIRSFYNPYFYDPFWDPFWDPYWGFSFYGPSYSFGWGWGGYYPGWNWGWGGWYNPWYTGYYGYGYGYGWGGYYPGWNWGWGGWYDPVYYTGGGYGGSLYTGIQNHTGRRGGSNAVRNSVGTPRGGILGATMNPFVTGRTSATSTRIAGSTTKNGVIDRSAVSGNTGVSATRLSTGRSATNVAAPQQIQGTRTGRGETLSNLRRSSNVNPVQGNGVINQGNSSARPVSSGRDYTPTYNRPRMNTQPTYSSSSTRQYSTPQSTGGNSQTYRYSRPQGSYSGESRSTAPSYQRGSATNAATRSVYSGSSRGSYPSMQSGSTSRSYSAPASSGVSRSYSGGSGGSVGNMGGSSGNSGSSGTRSSSGGGRTR